MTTRDNTRVTHRAPRRGPLQAGTLGFAWLLTAALRGALAAIVVLAVLGLPLAIAGRFHRALLPALVLVWLAILVLWQRLGGAGLPPHWASVLVFAVALGTAWINATHAAQHLLVDRDPGVYVVTAQHLATDGGLFFPARQGPFGDFPALRYAGAGFQGAQQLFPLFFHLLPV
ncbi:MAG: hypothetical protein M3N51_04745, partial [Actinomycetota bacterium]|nr:hypothetical protein [Actinomycetota bacterium]